MKICSNRIRGTEWDVALNEPESKETKSRFVEGDKWYREMEERLARTKEKLYQDTRERLRKSVRPKGQEPKSRLNDDGPDAA